MVVAMQKNTASRTALGAARLRYVHQILDNEPKILDDPIIGKIIGEDILIKIEETKFIYRTHQSMSLRSSIILRSRYAEDRLHEAYKNDIRQYMILGAGLDTFPYRQPQWAKELKIFEVDHPSTQEEKKYRLRKANIEIPPNLVFVPIDFESANLDEELERHGFRKDIPSFSSWLGVTVYLLENTIDNMLKFIVSFAPKSELVFSFAQKMDNPTQDIKPINSKYSTADSAAYVGEPWITFFTLQELERKLTKIGFRSFEFLDEESRRKYYKERNDGLEPPKKISVVRVIV